MGMGDEFHLYQYLSDDGENYYVKLSDEMAEEGGFPSAAGTTIPAYPYNSTDKRHVLGRSDDGKRGKLYLATPDDPKFVSGGTFSLHGRTYVIQGKIGERRAVSHVGG